MVSPMVSLKMAIINLVSKRYSRPVKQGRRRRGGGDRNFYQNLINLNKLKNIKTWESSPLTSFLFTLQGRVQIFWCFHEECISKWNILKCLKNCWHMIIIRTIFGTLLMVLPQTVISCLSCWRNHQSHVGLCHTAHFSTLIYHT